MNDATELQVKSLVIDQPKKAFEILFESYYALAARAAYFVTKSESVAEDLTQEMFLTLWDKKDQISNIASIKGYLLTSVKNLALNHIEKNKNRNTRESAFMELVSVEDSHENESNLKNVIEKMVDGLAPRTRLVFSMSRFEGLTNDEISEYLNISKRTVETQISLAIRSLKQEAKNSPAMISAMIVLALLSLFKYLF